METRPSRHEKKSIWVWKKNLLLLISVVVLTRATVEKLGKEELIFFSWKLWKVEWQRNTADKPTGTVRQDIAKNKITAGSLQVY